MANPDRTSSKPCCETHNTGDFVGPRALYALTPLPSFEHTFLPNDILKSTQWAAAHRGSQVQVHYVPDPQARHTGGRRFSVSGGDLNAPSRQHPLLNLEHPRVVGLSDGQ
jgi:hypothetical protein